MTIGHRVRTGGQVAFFTILLGLVGCGSESGTPMDRATRFNRRVR